MNRSFLRCLLFRKKYITNPAVAAQQRKTSQGCFPLPFSHTEAYRSFCRQSAIKTLKRHDHMGIKGRVPVSNAINVQSKGFSSDVADMKNDPETKALLKEIHSDFESERVSLKKEKEQSGESVTDDSTMPVVEDSQNGANSDVKGQNIVGFSVDETRTTSISLQRGRSGVFDLEELVTLLEEENGRDITVIEIPPEARYAEHMVVVSALSLRHLRNISNRIKWIHKRKKDGEDPFLRVEGLETAPDWHAMDLGNIILHVFMPDTREYYDLETLWTNWGQPGQEVEADDPYEISPDDEFWTNLEAQKQEAEKETK